MGGVRSPTPPTSTPTCSSDDDGDNYQSVMEDCADVVVHRVRRVMNTNCRVRVGSEVRAWFSARLREAMEPAFLDSIINVISPV